MAVTVANLVAGPGTLYSGTFGATEPAASAVGTAPASATWGDLGGTLDGSMLKINQEYFELEVDQVVDIVGRRLQKREISIETQLAEPTLLNLSYALNGGTIVASTGWSSYDPDDASSVTQPTYRAFILDGYAPSASAAKTRRTVLRRGLITSEMELAYKKDEQTVIPVEIFAHYVSSTTKPFQIVDAT
jgi:hypothetical protein